MTDKIVVLSNCDSQEQASYVARHLVEERVAACVNIVPGVRSIYRWKGKLEDSAEWLLVIKSRRDLLPRLKEELKKVHSYEVPEVIVLQVIDGSEEYIAWLDASLAQSSE